MATRAVTKVALKALSRTPCLNRVSFVEITRRSLVNQNKSDLSTLFGRSVLHLIIKPSHTSQQLRYFNSTRYVRDESPTISAKDPEVQKVDEIFRRIQWFYKLPKEKRLISVPNLLEDIETILKSPLISSFMAFLYQPLMALSAACLDELKLNAEGAEVPAWIKFEQNMNENDSTDVTKQFLKEINALYAAILKDRSDRNAPTDPINFDNLKLHPHVRAHFHRGLFYYTGEPVHLTRMVNAYHEAAIGTEDQQECVKYMQDCSVALSTVMIYNPHTVQMFMHIGKTPELEQTLAPMIFDIVGRLDVNLRRARKSDDVIT